MTAQPLTDEQYAAIRAREAAATPGPWAIEWDHDDVTDAPFPVSLGPIGYLEHHGERDVADAEFVAHARADVPALLAEVDRLRAERAEAAQLSHQYRNECERLRAENEGMRAVQQVHMAGFEAVLLIADRDPNAAADSSTWHEAIGYNDALSAVRDAIAHTAAPPATN
jgi:hypothetical protein